MTFVCLSLDEALAIHFDQIERYGGSHGIRDLDLIIASINRPAVSFGGRDLYEDIFTKTSAMMHSLILNHPFIDGNKRTGMVGGARMLYLNGYILKIDGMDLVTTAVKIATKDWKVEELSLWLSKHSKRI